MIINREYIDHDASWLLYVKSFIIGSRFDLAVAAYLHFALILCLLACWLTIRFIRWYNWQSKILLIANGLLAVFCICFLVIDAQFYHEFSQHLSYKETDYLTSPELAGTIVADYPLVLPTIIIILISGFYLYFSKKLLLKARLFEFKKRMYLVWLPFNFLLATGLLIVAARGGIGLSNLNWGASVFSSDPFANQLALNGLFSFGKSYDLEKNDDGQKVLAKMQISYMDAVKIIRHEIDSNAVYLNPLTGNQQNNPLARITRTGLALNKKNVVVLLLESWMAEYIGVLGSQSNLTPNFDKLANEGVLFTNFYAGGTRSNRGIVSVVTGYPSHYGKSVMKQILGQKPFYSLPGILKERGYQTSFIYGGDPEFDNMKGFLINNGVNTVIGQRDFPIDQASSKWGVNDEIMFSRAADFLSKEKEPFFSLIFTISNHEPFETAPEFQRFGLKDSTEYKFMNTYAYSDYALGKFFEQIKKTNFYENTIFVLVADHGKNRSKNWDIDPHRYHIPLLILNSGLSAQRITTTGGQTDILATVMSLLGGEYTQASWGRNLFDQTKENAVYLSPGDIFGLVRKDTLLTVDLNGNPTAFLFSASNKNTLNQIADPKFSNNNLKIAKAYFALSYSLLKKQSYGK